VQSPTSNHCTNNAADRALGEHWERQFCVLAAGRRKAFTPQQIGRTTAASWFLHDGMNWRTTLLPDVTIWTCPGEHHEIKHKRPTSTGKFGLEKYRLEALLAFQAETQQTVLYTIHNWALAGAENSGALMPNKIDDWQTVDVRALELYVLAEHLQPVFMDTWFHGEKVRRPGYYWPTFLWMPLARWWG